MAEPEIQKDIELAREHSVQSRAREETLGHNVLLVLTVAGQLLPAWWSRQRDMKLREYWKQIDHLAGAIYTFESRLSTIPFLIEPRDPNFASHRRLAEQFQEILLNESEFGEGWNAFYEPWIEDLITQDNGAFGEIVGDGPPEGPIVGMPLGIAHMDSQFCIRTGNPVFPVVFQDPKEGYHKMHYTRVFYSSQMPSPNIRMNKVGFCAISRCLNISQNLLDMMIYKQEKFGSRPQRGIIVTKGGLDPEDVREALKIANESMDNQGLRRYSRHAVIGAADLPEAALEVIETTKIPDGFDEEKSTILAMAAISLALGVDARELFPSMSIGATRADALLSHLKQRGKGYGQVLEITERGLTSKFLPDVLKITFDYQDDAQDQQQAEIKAKRAERHQTYIKNLILTERVVREQMLSDGDISQEQFENLELEDGRLPDGQSVLALFYMPDSSQELNMGVDDPLDTTANDAAGILALIKEKRGLFIRDAATANPGRRQELRQFQAALDQLELTYGGKSAEAARGARIQPAPAEDEEEVEENGGTEEEGILQDVDSEDLELDDLTKAGDRTFRRMMRSAAVEIRKAAQRIGQRET